jgi:hypothetical protein
VAGDELFFTRNSRINRAPFSNGAFTVEGPVIELEGGSTCGPTLTHECVSADPDRRRRDVSIE